MPRRVLLLILFVLGVAACSGGESAPGSTTPASSSTTAAAISSTTTTTTAATTTTVAGPLDVEVTVLGPEEVVFDWSEDACGPDTHPDLPTLVYRGADGGLNLILSSPSIHRMVGPDFDSLVVDCDPIRLSAEDPDPAAFRFREWMGSLWTEDGETVHAVIHNEYHGDEGSLAASWRDFSDSQGTDGWTYLREDSSGHTEMGWSGEDWRSGASNCLVAWWGAHPDAGCRAVRRWTAQEGGEHSFFVTAADAGIGGGDGVEIGLGHNGADIWTRVIEEGDEVGVAVNLDLVLAEGDTIDFWVDARDDASFDATNFRIEINRGERPCTVGHRSQCLMTALTYSYSTDGGDTFATPVPRDHLIAAVPQPYEPDHGAVGYWQPSNIVQHPSDGHWYMLIQIDIHQESRDVTGMCLLRTPDLSDPAAWRAWDGDGFGHQFVDPYGEGAAGEPICTAVVDAPAWSLTWNSHLERFVLLSEIPRLSRPGIYLRTSADLVEWSAPTLVMESEIGFANGFQTPFEAYPSLIDHESPSRSFDVTGQEGYVYFTRINGYDPLDFDLFRIPIRLEIAG